MRSTMLALILAAAGAAGCAMSRSRGPEISQADFGRLSPGQMAPVDAARGNLFAARDAVSRAKLKLQEAQHEIELSRADRTAARAQEQRDVAMAEAAKESGDAAAQARGQGLADAARLRIEAARAHEDYARGLVKAREAAVALAEAHVGSSEARLERAKLTALSKARIPAATKYDPAPLDAAVSRARAREDDRRADANETKRSADEARSAWRALSRRYQARVEGVGEEATGTGSGAAPGGDEDTSGREPGSSGPGAGRSGSGTPIPGAGTRPDPGMRW